MSDSSSGALANLDWSCGGSGSFHHFMVPMKHHAAADRIWLPCRLTRGDGNRDLKPNGVTLPFLPVTKCCEVQWFRRLSARTCMSQSNELCFLEKPRAAWEQVLLYRSCFPYSLSIAVLELFLLIEAFPRMFCLRLCFPENPS